MPGFKAFWSPYTNYLCLAFMAVIICVIWMIPPVRASVYAMPVWVLIIYGCYRLRMARHRNAASGSVTAVKKAPAFDECRGVFYRSAVIERFWTPRCRAQTTDCRTKPYRVRLQFSHHARSHHDRTDYRSSRHPPLPVLDACKWEKLEGDPHTVNLNAYTSEDGSKIMGTWICTPGKWYVEYVKWEYCDFREGYCIITPEGKGADPSARR